MSIAHSALRPCVSDKACGQCFNNLVDPRGFTLMTTPKVATQSIYKVYKDSDPHLVRFSSKQFVIKHCKNHFKIGFVRNPFDRLVSCWMDKCVVKPLHRTWDLYGLTHKMTFDAFARTICEIPHEESDKHWRLQSFDLFASNMALPHVFVHYENLAAEWDAARQQIESKTRAVIGPLPVLNTSGHKPFREYYTPDLIELVGDYFHQDLINFNYSFDQQPDLQPVAATV